MTTYFAGRTGKLSQSMTDFRRISKRKPPGQQLEIPDSARDVTVESLPADGGVRVSYLLPVQTVKFASDTDDAPRTYVH